MTTILFETPGLIDPRAFTTMGLSAKPNSTNPIGWFGTGLKYALAVLVRLGAEPVVLIGRDRYSFRKEAGEFRGVAYDGIKMRLDRFTLTRGRTTELPFTTAYGRNWKPWMAFRELESNTRDEGGSTSAIDVPAREVVGVEGATRIAVDLPAFVEAWQDRDTFFLKGAVREGSGIQIVDGSTKNLYWRGLRVLEVGKPCLMTYNFLDHLELTEDRTLYLGDYFAKKALGDWIVKCEDEATISRLVTAGDDFWESDVKPNDHVAPSAAFHRVMMNRPNGLGSGWGSYYSRHDPRPLAATFDLLATHPRPWKREGDAVLDANDREVFRAPYDYEGRWEPTADALVRMIAPEKREVADETQAHQDDPLPEGFVEVPAAVDDPDEIPL